MANLSEYIMALRTKIVNADIGGLGATGSPSYMKIVDTGGTARYLFYDTSGNLREHTSIPTQDSDGSPISVESGSAGDGLSESSGVLSVNVDDSTIETSTDTLRVKDAGITQAKMIIAEARTVTTDGTTTGTIGDTSTIVTVTSDSADKILVLPTPTPGRVVWILNAGTGYELRSDTPASVAINGGTGANVESAIGANELIRAVCASATAWICSSFATNGTESAVAAAA